MVEYSERINRGGFTSFIRRVPLVGTAVQHVQLVNGVAEGVVRTMGALAGVNISRGGWEASARLAAAAVAIRVANNR